MLGKMDLKVLDTLVQEDLEAGRQPTLIIAYAGENCCAAGVAVGVVASVVGVGFSGVVVLVVVLMALLCCWCFFSY